MKRGNTRPFRAPRPSKPVETVHRKDNAEWGKRIEGQLAQIEKRQKRIETKQDSDNKMLSEPDADETPKLGKVQRCSSNSEGDEVPISQSLLRGLNKPKETTVVTETEQGYTYEWRRDTNHNSELVGVKVTRDFGDLGVFVGEVIALEYDSCDDAKESPFYVVRYSDGDQEDLNEEEFNAALELHFNIPISTNDKANADDKDSGAADECMSSGSYDEESYVPSPEFKSFCRCQCNFLTVLTLFSPSL
jgi:hypothetical protein